MKKKSVDNSAKVKGKEKGASRAKKKLQDTEKEGSSEPEQMENRPCDEEPDSEERESRSADLAEINKRDQWSRTPIDPCFKNVYRKELKKNSQERNKAVVKVKGSRVTEARFSEDNPTYTIQCRCG